MNNNMNNRGHFRHHNQFLHPDDAYYRQELSSTTANVTEENNFDLKGGFRLKLSNVRQFLLILLIWSLSVTILSLLIWLIVLPQFPLLNVIETSSGRLLGTLETRLNGKRIVIYYGIPYARPPIGPRRFTRPEPSLPWKGVYKATTKPPSCYQFASDSPKNLPQSEDCLYLNLYVPLNEEGQQEDEEFQTSKINQSESDGLNEGFNGTASKPYKGKPVLVFIHSGGFMVGSINQYDPSILAIEGDLIVVTIGYRLGLFGFIYYELTGEPAHQQGNLGLYDQLLALQWIHANIHHFKGDPDNIVLFGDFAGAQSVGFHLISNRSQPYFKRAILLNGSPFNLALVMSRERSLNRTKALINATDCWSIDDNQTQNSSKVELPITSRSIDCLRNLKAPHLIQIDRSLYQKSKSSAMYLTYYPVAEESFFSSHPFELIESGDYGPQSEIMVGVNGHYESWMQDLGLTDFILNGMKLGSTEITPKMINRLAKFGPNIGQHYYEMLTQVIMEDHSAVSPTDLAERINSLTLDMAFRCPNYFLVNSFIQNETRSVYYFELRASTGFELMNKMLTSLTNNDTSSKTTDVSMIFGYPLESITEDGKGGYNEDDVAFSKIMINHWVEFIKNGKPTSNNSWIPCKNEQQYYRYIIKKKGSILKSGFVENQCDKYFRILYDIGKSIGKH